MGGFCMYPNSLAAYASVKITLNDNLLRAFKSAKTVHVVVRDSLRPRTAESILKACDPLARQAQLFDKFHAFQIFH